jgi:arsenical pump membrane protein
MTIELFIVLAAMGFCVFAAVRPFRIGPLKMDMAQSSFLVALLTTIGGITPLELWWQTFTGKGLLVPWEVLVIFFGAAYVSISVDATGVLELISKKIVYKADGKGGYLFFFIYGFSCLLTLFTSNDIVILTLTPIIFYLSKYAHINPIPLLFVQFFGANTLSMLLYIGNPTNIIVGNTLGLDFFAFTRTLWLPTLVATLSNAILLLLVFRKTITWNYSLKTTIQCNISSKGDVIISTGILIMMLMALLFSSLINWPIWLIVAASAIFLGIHDIIFPRQQHKWEQTISRMPWKIFPFICLFFILTEALHKLNLTSFFALQLTELSHSSFSAIISSGVLSFIMANLMNNQPMTILFSSIITHSDFNVTIPIKQASAYAVIIASNLGANFTFLGALVALMWKKILSQKGIRILWMDFFRVGLAVTPLSFLLALMSLWFVLNN